MRAHLGIRDFMPYKGRWIAFQIHTSLPRGVELPWHRAWLWGVSLKFVYLADSQALSIVWMVPHRLFYAIRASLRDCKDPHVIKADWYDAWCRLYEIRDLPQSVDSAFVRPDNHPEDQQLESFR